MRISKVIDFILAQPRSVKAAAATRECLAARWRLLECSSARGETHKQSQLRLSHAQTLQTQDRNQIARRVRYQSSGMTAASLEGGAAGRRCRWRRRSELRSRGGLRRCRRLGFRLWSWQVLVGSKLAQRCRVWWVPMDPCATLTSQGCAWLRLRTRDRCFTPFKAVARRHRDCRAAPPSNQRA